MPVNEQITDSVTQVNTKVVGETPAVAFGNLSQSEAASQNATSAQQQGQITMQAATVQGVEPAKPVEK